MEGRGGQNSVLLKILEDCQSMPFADRLEDDEPYAFDF
jgi:hypothetical protein